MLPSFLQYLVPDLTEYDYSAIANTWASDEMKAYLDTEIALYAERICTHVPSIYHERLSTAITNYCLHHLTREWGGSVPPLSTDYGPDRELSELLRTNDLDVLRRENYFPLKSVWHLDLDRTWEI